MSRKRVSLLPYSQFHATEILVTANIAVFLLTSLYPVLQIYLGLVPGMILSYHSWWQVFTYMFVHGGVWHLLMNMLTLFIFGRACEQQLGSGEFLLYYLVVGTLSGIFSYFSYLLLGTNVILIGASGAIYGLLFLFAVLFPRARMLIWGIIPIRAPMAILLYAVVELASEVFSVAGGVSHLCHLWGLAGAALWCVVRFRINPFRYMMM